MSRRLVLLEVNDDVLEREELSLQDELGWMHDSGVSLGHEFDIPEHLIDKATLLIEELVKKEDDLHCFEPTDSQGYSMTCTKCGDEVSFFTAAEWEEKNKSTCNPKEEESSDAT